ncbi:MAG: AAA family ATPase [Nostoc sp.]|uniref:AAA family ATPase n=1 Tax=Nostoc sp. TaxID=1180 RepID=UPI002FF4FBDC
MAARKTQTPADSTIFPVDSTATSNGSKPNPRSLLQTLRTEVNQYVLEREEVIDGIIAALLAKKHVVQIGPKGCAKSFTCDLIASAFCDLNYFSKLLHQDTPPDELFGPPNLKELRDNGVLKRNIEGRLPWAHLANLEEIFNGPDMLFGSLHRVANERIFENPTPEDCPLFSIIGSSNHLPGEKAEAFLDRILLKYPVDYLQDPANKKKLMMNRVKPNIQTKISLADLVTMHSEVEQVKFPEIIADTLLNLELKLAQEMSIFISDCRRGDIIDLLKAYAYMLGEDAVSEEHLDILPYCLWNDPKQMGGINSIVLQIGSPVTAKAIEVFDAAKQLYNQVGDIPSNAYEDKANTWQVKASGSTKQMKTMINDLNHLLASTPNASPSAIRKVNDTINKIEAMKNEVFEKVKSFLQQE